LLDFEISVIEAFLGVARSASVFSVVQKLKHYLPQSSQSAQRKWLKIKSSYYVRY